MDEGKGKGDGRWDKQDKMCEPCDKSGDQRCNSDIPLLLNQRKSGLCKKSLCRYRVSDHRLYSTRLYNRPNGQNDIDYDYLCTLHFHIFVS